MKAKLQLQRSVYEEQIRTALHAHWHASAAGDTAVEPASQNRQPISSESISWLTVSASASCNPSTVAKVLGQTL
jgi:hypothetical protein